MTNKIYEAHLQVNRHFIFTTEARVHCARASEKITLEEMEKFDKWKYISGWRLMVDEFIEGEGFRLWGYRNENGMVKSTKDLIQDYLNDLTETK